MTQHFPQANRKDPTAPADGFGCIEMLPRSRVWLKRYGQRTSSYLIATDRAGTSHKNFARDNGGAFEMHSMHSASPARQIVEL